MAGLVNGCFHIQSTKRESEENMSTIILEYCGSSENQVLESRF